MPRFTFSQRLESQPSEDSYNQIIEDFENFINTTKLDKDNLNNQAVRFRHLSSPPTVSLFADCGDFIWSTSTSYNLATTGRSGSFELFKDNASDSGNRDSHLEQRILMASFFSLLLLIRELSYRRYK